MKILCFTQFFLPEVGGMQISNSLLVQGLIARGAEVELHIFGRSKDIKKRDLFTQYEHSFSATSLLGHIRVAWLVVTRSRSVSVDVVLLLDESVVRALGLLPFKVNSRTCMVGVNSGSVATRKNSHVKGKIHSWLIRRGYQMLRKMFFAEATASLLVKRYPYLAEKICSLGRPIPKEFFVEPKNPPDWPPKVGLPIFISAGRASQDKGMHLVVEALAQLKDVHGSELIEYWHIGDGPALAGWQCLANSYSLQQVRFIGNVNFSQLARYYEKAHFFILPSMGDMETFGRVWVEAMAFAKPVVSTRLDNLKNLVFDSENGFIVEASPTSVREGIERCMALDGEQYFNMSRKSYEIASKYKLDRVVESLIEKIQG